jgi:hypothetical protein
MSHEALALRAFAFCTALRDLPPQGDGTPDSRLLAARGSFGGLNQPAAVHAGRMHQLHTPLGELVEVPAQAGGGPQAQSHSPGHGERGMLLPPAVVLLPPAAAPVASSATNGHSSSSDVDGVPAAASTCVVPAQVPGLEHETASEWDGELFRYMLPTPQLIKLAGNRGWVDIQVTLLFVTTTASPSCCLMELAFHPLLSGGLQEHSGSLQGDRNTISDHRIVNKAF